MTLHDDTIHPGSIAEAREIQNRLKSQIDVTDNFGTVQTIAGVDVGYDIKDNQSRASIVVLDARSLAPLKTLVAQAPTEFPYVPGLLSFREIPVILKALGQLEHTPDLLMVDGQGIAHPRRMGIAAHLGLVVDLPAIGVAKSRLCGKYAEPGLNRGARSDLVDKGEIIGTVLRSRDNVKPLFVSPGHRVSHETAIEWVERCLTRYRLPEPTRLADKLSKFAKTGTQSSLI